MIGAVNGTHSHIPLLILAMVLGGLGAAPAAGASSLFRGASSDGTRVFFVTTDRLVSADTDSSTDVYERSGATTTLVSVGQVNGNGSFGAAFEGASSDGSRVFFSTKERLADTDTDSAVDIYERSGAVTSHVSRGQINGNDPHDAVFQDASSDGAGVFFQTDERLASTDVDAAQDVYQRANGTATQLSRGSLNGNGPVDAFFEGASSSGARVFFRTDEVLLSTDGDGSTDIYQRTGGAIVQVSQGQINGDGPHGASFRGVSTDGSRVFFQTEEKLTSTDGDAAQDVYERAGGATTQLSQGQINGNNDSQPAGFQGASSDGTRVFFCTREQLADSDSDSSPDIYERSEGSTKHVSQGQVNGNGVAGAIFNATSSDGTRVFFQTSEQLADSDSDLSQDVYERSGGATTHVSRGQIDGNGSFGVNFEGASSDGTRVFLSTPERLTGSDTDSQFDIYERSAGTTTQVSQGNGPFPAFEAGISSDGSRVFLSTAERLSAADTDGFDDVYERSGGTTRLVAVEGIPPETTLTGGPGSPTTDRTTTFSFASSEPESTFECSVDGGPFLPCGSPHSLDPLPVGEHTFRVSARDLSGNVDPSPASLSFRVEVPPATGGGVASRPSIAAIRAALAGDLRAAARVLRRLGTKRVLRRRRAGVRAVDALEPGTVRITGRAGRTLVLTGSRRFGRAGKGTLTLKLTSQGRRLLGRKRSLRLVLRASFTGTGRSSVSAGNLKVRIGRPR